MCDVRYVINLLFSFCLSYKNYLLPFWLFTAAPFSYAAAALYGELIKDGDQYRVSSTIYSEPEVKRFTDLSGSRWRFNLVTLKPGFDSRRFECVRSSPPPNGCETFEKREDSFVYVNFMKSGYGDVNKTSSSIKVTDVPGVIIATPFLAAAGAVALPIVAIGALVEPGKTAETVANRKNWVEFNHDEFSSRVTKALSTQWLASADKLESKLSDFNLMQVKITENVDAHNKKLLAQWESGQPALSPFVSSNLGINSFVDKQFVEMPKSFEWRGNVAETLDYVLSVLDVSAKEKELKLTSALEKEKIWLVATYKERERKDFDGAKSASDWRYFVDNFSVNDPLGLLSKAKAKLASAEALEKEQVAARQAVEEKRKAIEQLAAAKRLENFRSHLKVGDDTFCGPVIEVRRPMVKISVNAQLQGYSNEAWLKVVDIYPAEAGCSNTNGTLRPYTYSY